MGQIDWEDDEGVVGRNRSLSALDMFANCEAGWCFLSQLRTKPDFLNKGPDKESQEACT